MTHRVFLDASFWIAYRDQRQTVHSDACRILTELFQRRTRFATTWLVLCEVQAYFSRSARLREMVLTDLWNNPVCSVEPISYQDQEAAIDILRQSRDKSYSLCDVTSFVVMKRLGIQRVAAFDDHFRQFGEFEIVS